MSRAARHFMRPSALEKFRQDIAGATTILRLGKVRAANAQRTPLEPLQELNRGRSSRLLGGQSLLSLFRQDDATAVDGGRFGGKDQPEALSPRRHVRLRHGLR